MKILLVADGRSPITRAWIKSVVSLGHKVSLVSTFPMEPMDEIVETNILPIAFSSLSGSQAGKSKQTKSVLNKRNTVGRARSAMMLARYYFGPFSIPFYKREFQNLVHRIKPDLVHALRIPFEGFLASTLPKDIPLVLSIWGNDLTFHSKGSFLMEKLTSKAIHRANGLMADTQRDVRLSKLWGLPEHIPTLVVPGNGGIDLFNLNKAGRNVDMGEFDGLTGEVPWVINPRGFRPGSVRNDTFFQSIPLILQRRPGVRFLCPAMEGQPEALQWLRKLNISDFVILLPFLSQEQLWGLFFRSKVSVSISQHDGTPNSLLEAMACGCLPVAGDIESMREWIVAGVNGLLVNPNQPHDLAESVLLALENEPFRKKAADINIEIINNRASIDLVRTQIACFYQQLLP